MPNMHGLMAAGITFNKILKVNINDVSLVLKDSDMDSENLISLIQFSVSDSQKTDSSKVVSLICI